MIKLNLNKELIGTEGKFNLNFNVEINEREFITLYGPSGAGKTTILKMIAGLLNPDKGKIIIENKLYLDTSNKINLSPQQRSIGFVFQDYALFPNMSVRKNLEYALVNKKVKNIINELLEITDLKNLENRKPETLSGGQKQRVALARALVRKPKILLLDEPLSAIDPDMRKKLQDEILKVHKKFNLTTILVSHDFSEIFRLSNKIIVLEKGKIVKQGNLSEVFIDKKLSGKYKFEGEILQIVKNEVVYIVTAAIGNNIVKVIATDDEVKNLEPGSKVIVSSKAFNPVIIPVEE